MSNQTEKPNLTGFWCPACGKAIAQRVRVVDKQPFYACTGFPLCKKACNIDEAKTKLLSVRPIMEEQIKVVGSDQQEAIWDEFKYGRGHILTFALAGTGKSFTAVEGCKRTFARRITFAAFNRTIAQELREKVPDGVRAATLHSVGFTAIRRAFPTVQEATDGYRARRLLNRYFEDKDKNNCKPMKNAVLSLVALCKNLLIEPTNENLEALAIEFDVDLELPTDDEVLSASFSLYSKEPIEGKKETAQQREYKIRIFALVINVLKDCADRDNIDWEIDYDDMIWLPVVLDLEMYQNDMLIIDEAQDLNKCQQELIKKIVKARTGRFVVIGDVNQAIYRFRGADSDGMNTMRDYLSNTSIGLKEFPLTKTRRCGKAIVEEAKILVPSFEAMDEAPEGKVVVLPHGDNLHQIAKAGDFILCRTNAPLLRQWFKLFKAGKKAVILGRDIASTLINLIDKLKADSVSELKDKVAIWEDEQTNILIEKDASESQIQFISDKADAIRCLCENLETIFQVKQYIENIFEKSEDGKLPPNSIILCTIHKSKGLEADRVFIIETWMLPFGSPEVNPEAYKQELNLIYVAITRAKHELYYVGARPEILKTGLGFDEISYAEHDELVEEYVEYLGDEDED